MKGSEKQINWAENIKAEKDFNQFLGKGRNEAANAVIAKAVDFISSIDSAKFWIDNRNSSEMDIMKNFMSQVGIAISGDDHADKAVIATDGTITVTRHNRMHEAHTETF